MLVVALVLGVATVALFVALQRSSARVADLEATVVRREAELARAEAELVEVRALVDHTGRERDDALERASRARRDAADVARRMAEEVDARTALAERLAEVEAAVREGDDGDVAELWELALAGVRRTWEVSVAPSPGLPTPLDDADDLLRAAVEVEVDAAREEAGAAIDLEWTGDHVAPPAVAVRALSILQELIARLAKGADAAVLAVASTPEGVTIGVQAEGGDVPADVAVDHRTADATWVIPA